MFQEVYDWAGSREDVPLHFTIQNGDKVITHDTPVVDHCSRSLIERSEKEVQALISSQVSFKGNFQVPEDLSSTLVESSPSNGQQPLIHWGSDLSTLALQSSGHT
ncbi:uncharacterized protein [Montipora capricornis]|uniref:uncharacterized protein n=1 Tax=Montipora capricornis TaxID=246305 RepID=UPI0035F14326